MPLSGDPAEIETMLQLKLEVPRLPANVVDRPRLTSALDAMSACRLVLLTAPAGFGKTTLLSQWRDHLHVAGQRAAWLTIDDDDADVRRFLNAVLQALEHSGPEEDPRLLKTEAALAERPVGALIREIVGSFARSSTRVTLILDDYHRAACGALDAVLARLIAQLPDQARILMSVRSRPDVGIHQLLASGEAIEIGSDMLRFTRDESRQLLDTGQPNPDIDMLADRIEGWPVALQLTRVLALQSQATPASLARLTSRSGHLWSFLSDQVLRGLPEECVDFLLDTSILERFTPEITDAVRGRSDSWSIIERLEPLQSLLTPLHPDNNWFRYHHLFAEYLQGQLRQRRPSDLPRLHLRASIAFETHGLLVEAVRHSSAAGDYARCADLVERAGGWRLILFGGMGQLQQLLEFIPKAERLSHPRLLLAEAYLRLKLGDVREARSTFDLVASEPLDLTAAWHGLDDFHRDLLNVGVLIRTYEDNSIDKVFFDTFIHQPDARSGDDGLTRGVLLCAGAVTSLCVGELARTEELARDAMGAMRSVNSVLGLNYCFLHAGMASAYRGDLRAALAYLHRAEAMAIENFGADSGLKAISQTLLCATHLWKEGDITFDVTELDEAFHHVRDYDGWFEIYSAGLDTRFRIACLAWDEDAMERTIADGDSLVRLRGQNRLASILDAQRLLLQRGSRSGATTALAEQIEQRFSKECWKRDPTCWRPYQDAGFALASWCRESAPDRASRIATDLANCARAVGSIVYEVRALMLGASVARSARYQREAATLIERAVELAANEHIALPFLEQPTLTDLMVDLERSLWSRGERPLEASFLSNVLRHLADRSRRLGAGLGLSAREQEVMRELADGMTNKEIARTLEMTEHTVKFHLKNIFVKLGVDRRAHAIAIFHSPKRSQKSDLPTWVGRPS